MDQPTPEELRRNINMIQDHHERLRNIEEYLRFPSDYGPADHIHHHISSKMTEKRKGDLHEHIIKSVVWVAVLFVLGLLAIGAKQWLLQPQ